MPSKLKKYIDIYEARKAKSERRKCCATFKAKNYVEILLSAHAELCKHLAEKAAECTTWKQVCREV